MTIPLIAHSFLNEPAAKDALCAFIRDASHFSAGERVAEWERAFATWHGSKTAVCVNSGSSANLALVQALLNLGRLDRGDVVVCSAVTWATNVMPLLQLGLRPLFADIALTHLNMTSGTLRTILDRGPAVRCVFVTHALGLCGDVEEIVRLCAEREVLLIEDCCEAMGTIYQGRRLGRFGLAATFSTFVGHHLSTIEGGLIATDDAELDRMLRSVRSHGWGRALPGIEREALRLAHHVSVFDEPYTFYSCGYNLRPTELTGVCGLDQLPFLEESLACRRASFRTVRMAAATNPTIRPLDVTHIDQLSPFAVPLVTYTHDQRQIIIERCQRMGIETRPLISGNMQRQPFLRPFLGRYLRDETDTLVCKDADRIQQCGWYLPCRSDLKDDEVWLMAKAITG